MKPINVSQWSINQSSEHLINMSSNTVSDSYIRHWLANIYRLSINNKHSPGLIIHNAIHKRSVYFINTIMMNDEDASPIEIDCLYINNTENSLGGLLRGAATYRPASPR